MRRVAGPPLSPSPTLPLYRLVWAAFCTSLLVTGCSAPKGGSSESITARMERHAQKFGRFRLPEQVGMVENVGLQLPVVSPDGEQILYLRLDAPSVTPLTLLGSDDPTDTPAEGTLSIWLRPVRGTGVGRRLSPQRWAHSAVWASSGRAVAYVVNKSPGSYVVHHDLATGHETTLGVAGAVNVLPRFDGDEHTLLFCAGASPAGPFRVYRQSIDEPAPTPLTPQGQPCALPVLTLADGHVVCARVDGSRLGWALTNLTGAVELNDPIGGGDSAGLLAPWAGIIEPVSPDRTRFLFYAPGEDRIAAYDTAGRRFARHRAGSVAACWIDNDSIAVATSGGLFVVDAFSGLSLSLMSGAWVPARFAPESRTLIVLGKGQAASRLTIYAIVFESADKEPS